MTRTGPLLLLLSLFVFVPALVIACALLADVSSAFALFAGLFVLLDFALLLLAMIPIFTALGRLRSKYPDALVGNAESVLPSAHSALRWVFRGDIRLSAYYLVGLVAEARGDFAQAAEAFACAVRAMPFGMTAPSKRRVSALAASHLAFCLAGARQRDAARDALFKAQTALMRGPGSFDFMDPLNAGLTTLGDVEPGRDPRALAALAGVTTAFANGAHREALDIITREGQLLHHGLLPRERAIVALLERRTRTALDGAGVMRAAAELEVAAANHDEAWAARYISAP